MSLNDIIPEGCVLPDLKATQKEDVFREMVAALVGAGIIAHDDGPQALRKLLERESLGSTGIGAGVAVPHAAHECELVCAVARSNKGVDYGALDGERVFLFFMLLSSTSASGRHLEALAALSRLVRTESLVQELRNAKSVNEMRDLLDGGELVA